MAQWVENKKIKIPAKNMKHQVIELLLFTLKVVIIITIVKALHGI